MNNNISVATIDRPEFINLQQSDISPLMSKCEIKVLYVGQNRNKSAISKKVATEMSKTLRGCPIVGQYIERKEDFGDHGDQMVIDGEGVHFNTLTRPYGFVSPDAKVWFQFFEDQDEFGNTCLREYLMTEGYLWTEQFKECKRVLQSGNGQSMELDSETLKGSWATDFNQNTEFFIINDAIFSKLCILGDDVEPCFEGSSITAPEVSSAFSKDEGFMKEMLSMLAELKYALNNSKGGLSMETQDTPIVETEFAETEQVEETIVETTEVPAENFSNEQGNLVESETVEIENTVEEFACGDKDKKKDFEKSEKKEDEEEKKDSEPAEESTPDSKEEDKEEEDSKKKFELLQSEYSELQNKYSSLEEKYNELVSFKQQVEEKEKDELIASFYMLSDEDKKDVIENKTQYSLDDIEAKLSVICVRKKVNFSLEEETSEKTEDVSVTFNLDNHQVDTLPAWLRAVEDCKNR